MWHEAGEGAHLFRLLRTRSKISRAASACAAGENFVAAISLACWPSSRRVSGESASQSTASASSVFCCPSAALTSAVQATLGSRLATAAAPVSR